MTGAFQALSFAFPQALWALLALPVIWWLLRFTPPRPRRIEFPPYRLLLLLLSKEEQPDRTPWWLIALRLVLAGLIILAVARPILGDSAARPGGEGPLLLIVDDGWPAARTWNVRRAYLQQLIGQAERGGRTVAVATTAPRTRPDSLALSAAAEAREKVATIEPRALDTERLALLDRLEPAFADAAGLQVVWLSDGIDGGSAAAFAEGLAKLAGGSAAVEAVVPADGSLGPALAAPQLASDGIKVTVLRPAAGGPGSFAVRAEAGNGRTLAERQINFAAADVRREATIELPLELRNELARVEIAGEASAGAVQLMDDRWRRKVVGIITGASLELEQPLLSPLYYPARALEPYAEVRKPPDDPAALRDFVAGGLSMLVLADVGVLPADSRQTIADWVEAGGVLLRFAGPRLAGGHDDLIPVELRTGGRELGSALSWEAPQGIAAFPSSSPFAGLAIDPEIKIRKQVLAEPSAELPERIWAGLDDGTPLITAGKRGRGLIVLFHVTANSDWSNLPLSGLFERMLRRILDFSRGAGNSAAAGAAGQAQAFTPLQALTGFGEISGMPVDAEPIAAQDIDAAKPSPRHPAGLYARAGATRALNLSVAESSFKPIGALPGNVRRATYEAGNATPLAGYLLAIAILLF
ncbi:MAG: BatA domain-containing protein, partial [Pseudomonadota bacterium]|nr:BatA domain-containing protein [Pseudomonadota bacterium]